MRRFGGLIASVLLLLPATSCMYSFAGGGLPTHIHSMAIATFDNQTSSPDIPKELYDEMRKELQRRLGAEQRRRQRPASDRQPRVRRQAARQRQSAGREHGVADAGRGDEKQRRHEG